MSLDYNTGNDTIDSNNKKTHKVRNSIIALGSLGAIAVCSYFVGESYIDSTKIEVPSATKFVDYETTIDDACDIFIDKKLSCEVNWKIDNNAERGNLLSQSIASGEKVDEGTKIVLDYSKGKSESKMPDLSDVTLEDAKKELYNIGVNISEVKEIDNNNLDKGKVVKTSIDVGNIVKNGDKVVVEVSSGSITIPNWNGKTKEFVESDAKKNNIQVNFVEEESDKPFGTVIRQSPEAGTSEKVDAVDVTIAKSFENKEISIPDVIGETAEEAQLELATAGFRQIKTVEVPNNKVTEKQVTQVVPGVTEKAKTNDNIVIIVSVPENK